MNDTPNKPGFSRRILLSLGVLGAVGAVAGLGTYAQFTDSTSASHSVSTGTLSLDVGATGALTNRFSEAATAVAPGDTIQRSIDLNVAGTVGMASVTLASTTSTPSLLTTDTTNGLQLVVERCTVPWTESGGASARTYTCSGTTSTARAAGPVIQAATALTNLDLTAGASNHLRFTWSLPSGADDTFQGLSSTVDYSFVAAQRAGTNK